MKPSLLFCLVPVFFFSSVAAQENEVKVDSLKNELYKQKKIPKFSFSVAGGLSWRIAKTPSTSNAKEAAYYKDLKSGQAIDASVTYFFNKKFGIGLRFNTHISKVSITDYFGLPNGTNIYGKLDEKVSINFFGPNFSGRFFNKTKTGNFYFDAGFGLSTYSDYARLPGYFVKDTGMDVGVYLDGGYTVLFNRLVGAKIGFAYSGAALTSIDEDNNGSKSTIKFDPEQSLSTLHVDIVGGLVVLF